MNEYAIVSFRDHRSTAAFGAGVPAVGGPGAADQATDGDDRVGEVEEGIDDDLAAFVAAGEPTEGVVPGVGRPAAVSRCG
jgi:hypothetical protein